MAYETFILHGGPEKTPGGTIRQGEVRVKATAVVREVGGGVVFSGLDRVVLNEAGMWSFTLPCTDDPGLLPEGFRYELTFHLSGSGGQRSAIQGIAAPPGTVSLDAGTLTTTTAPAAVDAPAATAADLAALSAQVDANASAPTILADATSNPVLAAGEPGFATDTGDLRIGDGTSAWTALPETHQLLTKAAGNSTFASGVTLPAASGGDDLAALNAILAANPGKRITGRSGESYQISGPLVLKSGTTLDMTGCTITLTAGKRMVQNEATLGAGARDTDIHVKGGTWDRGAFDGASGFDLHSIVLHRVDRCSVTDLTVTSTAGKYAVYFVDATEATAERLNFNVASDGVHVTGPASRITVRDITGVTGDDVLSITGRDFTAYELTAGGGDVADILVENINPTNADGNAVKLLPGAGKTISKATVSKVGGSCLHRGVTLYEDATEASTLGGTIRDVTVRDVTITTPALYESVHVNHPDVKALLIDGITQANPSQVFCVRVEGTVGTFTLRNLVTTTAATLTHLVEVASTATIDSLVFDAATANLDTAGRLLKTTGGTVRNLTVRNLRLPTETAALVCELASSTTIEHITVEGVDAVLKADKTAGAILYVNGVTVSKVVTLRNINVSGGNAIIDIRAGSSVPTTHISQVVGTVGQLVYHRAANVAEVHVTALDVTGTIGVAVGAAGCSLVLRGGQIKGTPTAVFRSGTQTLRVVGAELRADIGNLTPSAGDLVYNTDAGEATGAGLSLYSGTAWKNLSV